VDFPEDAESRCKPIQRLGGFFVLVGKEWVAFSAFRKMRNTILDKLKPSFY